MSRVLVSPRCIGVLAILGACMLVPLVPVAVVVMSLPARATEPPPPVQFTVTVSTEEGGDCTLVRVREWYGTYIGEWTAWSTGPIQQTYDAGVNVEIDATVNCPCAYEFKEWVDEQGSVLDYRRDERHEFTLTHDTIATAVFKPRTGVLRIYVEDPTPDDYPHNGADVGHTFWKIDGTCLHADYDTIVGKAWGFYPTTEYPWTYNNFGFKIFGDYQGILINNSSKVNDNTYNAYHYEVINYTDAVACLVYTKSLKDNPPMYHVETFNCTTAAIAAAAQAGYTMPDSLGTCDEVFCTTNHSFNGNCAGTLGENL